MIESIQIEGMHCDGCIASVERVLGRFPLKSLHVEIGKADIEYDEMWVTHGAIVEAIEDAGYDVVRVES